MRKHTKYSLQMVENKIMEKIIIRELKQMELLV
jgi:hypothetical protein